MAYTIKLGTISKHIESTKQPNVTGWAEYNVTFKDGTEVENPTLTLAIDYDTVKAYNYAYMLNRYYWITSKTMLRNDLCVLKLKTDVLATYKTEIGNTSLYILRSSNAYNGYIPDMYYPPTANCTTDLQLQDPDTVPTVNFNSGYYLIKVMGRGTAVGGAEIVYQLDPPHFKTFISTIYDNINGFQLGDVINGVVKAWGGNPTKLISGVVWTPYSFPTVATNNVIIGGYSTQVSGGVVTKSAIDLAAFTYDVPKHPKAATKGKYLNTAPFSTYTLGVNCGSIFELDSTKLVDVSTLYVYRTLDINGQLETQVQSIGANHAFTHALIYSQMGVPIALDGNNSSTGVISAITSGAMGIITGGGSAVAIAGAAAAGIGTIANSISGATSNVANGSIAGISTSGRLVASFYDIPAEDNTHNGRPYCQVNTPATLGGFMVVSRGDVDINGTLEEEEEIKRFLESGFYFE